MEVRAAALQAAVTLVGGQPVRLTDVVKRAERLEAWITDGVLPDAPPGVMD